MKYIQTVLILCSAFIFISSTIYKPMTKRTINFGDDVCHYCDKEHTSGIEYVKPCEEGKKCTDISVTNSDYDIYICQPYEEEYYDNKDKACEESISCTSQYFCGSSGSCKADICPYGQIQDTSKNSFTCMAEPNYCEEYDYPSNNPTKSYELLTSKECVEVELKADNNNKNYEIEKVKFNTIASIEDGQYIKDSSRGAYIPYCKNGYALYFYGGQNLKSPGGTNEKMFLRCVTLLGRDEKGIIKYKIGNGDEKYYDPDDLPSTYKNSFKSFGLNDKYLLTRYDIFKNYKQRLESISDCTVLNCEDDELNKWYYFYYNPQEYILYQNEPQVMEYLVQKTYKKYKAKYTSPYESSFLLKIKYLALLSLILLF